MADSSAAIASAFSTTILGCPLSSFLALESACPATNVPACATLTPEAQWGPACCNSLYSYGTSIGSCYAAHAPSCLDTAAVFSSLSGVGSVSNPCAAYATGGAVGGSGSGTTPASTGATPTSAASTGSGTGAGAATTAGSGSSSASATAKSAGTKSISAGLKVYVGVALVGALAVLAL